MRHVLYFLVLAFVFLVFTPTALAGGDAADYLGPRPGLTLVFEDQDGVRMERRAVSRRGDILDMEETTKIPAWFTPEIVPSSSTRLYELKAQGPQLVILENGSRFVVLDFSKDVWAVPLTVPGQGQKEMQCRMGRPDIRQILGQDHKVQDVVCSYTVEGIDFQSTYTLAKGLGIVRMLQRGGGEVLSDMQLTKVKGVCTRFE